MSRPPHAPDAIHYLPRELNGSADKGRQLRAHLESMLKNMATGALLPSERVLADRLQIARGTVRAQIDTLVADGLVNRVPGRGTFVAAPRFGYTEKMNSFSRDMIARGMTPSSRVLSVRVRAGTPSVAEKLEIRVGAPIIALARIRYADAEPMALERTNLPATRFPGLEKKDLRRSLYEVLADDYGCEVDNAEQRVAVVSLTAADARRLGTTTRTPAFDMERVTRDRMGNVVEWGHAVLRGDRYDILMHVKA